MNVIVIELVALVVFAAGFFSGIYSSIWSVVRRAERLPEPASAWFLDKLKEIYDK